MGYYQVKQQDKDADSHDGLRARASHSQRTALCVITVEGGDRRYHETEKRHLETAVEDVEVEENDLDEYRKIKKKIKSEVPEIE